MSLPETLEFDITSLSDAELEKLLVVEEEGDSGTRDISVEEMEWVLWVN